MSSRWIPQHRETINAFLKFLNSESDSFVLKGGTALLTCYGLDRFSEDVDLDSKAGDIIGLAEKFCAKRGFEYRVAKDTETTKRCFINYGNDSKPLKVEVSHRRRVIPESETQRVNGILVYGIEQLCIMKANAYSRRDKIRGLYDLTFICNRYFEQLSPQAIALVRSALEYKGIEQFVYIVRQQPDELIDTKKLADDFLSLFDKLGLLYDSGEIELLKSAEKPEITITASFEESSDERPSITERIEQARQRRQNGGSMPERGNSERNERDDL